LGAIDDEVTLEEEGKLQTVVGAMAEPEAEGDSDDEESLLDKGTKLRRQKE
jgi:hypothetical protein